MAERREASRLPWYSFLYRFLGAQGTFYLWLVALITVWWTAKPAVVRMANRSPAPTTVAEARNPQGLTRWVKVHGVELELDRRLLQREGEGQGPPIRVLLDPEDPAAAWWVETRRLCRLAAGPPKTPETVQARLKLIELRTQLMGEGRQRALPAPERCLLLQDSGQTTLHLPPPRQERSGAQFADFEQAFAGWLALIPQRVHPDQTLEGVLDVTPQTVSARIQKDLDVVPAPYLLQLDRRPRETESIVFGVALLTLLFLAFGLHGAAEPKRAASAESDPDASDAPAPADPEASPAPTPEPSEA